MRIAFGRIGRQMRIGPPPRQIIQVRPHQHAAQMRRHQMGTGQFRLCDQAIARKGPRIADALAVNQMGIKPREPRPVPRPRRPRRNAHPRPRQTDLLAMML